MAQEQAAFAAALGALSEAEATAATLAGTYTNIIVGPQQDDAIPTAQEGLKLSETSVEQQPCWKAIETYVRDVNAGGADAISLNAIRLKSARYLRLAGTRTVDAENDYVRIDGPSVWIEFYSSRAGPFPASIPHSVWRDKIADYGGNTGVSQCLTLHVWCFALVWR